MIPNVRKLVCIIFHQSENQNVRYFKIPKYTCKDPKRSVAPDLRTTLDMKCAQAGVCARRYIFIDYTAIPGPSGIRNSRN